VEITPELLRKVLAAHALAGKEACGRIQNRLAIVAAMGEPAARATLRKRA